MVGLIRLPGVFHLEPDDSQTHAHFLDAGVEACAGQPCSSTPSYSPRLWCSHSKYRYGVDLVFPFCGVGAQTQGLAHIALSFPVE